MPVIKDADTLDFRGFWAAYEDLIRKVRTNKIGADDFGGATVTLTNPGTIGTVQSVPRLMPGQGVIVGVGSLDYPAEWQAADPRVLAELGVSKVVTLTSTYDHRIIQGAESGVFLQRVHRLLLGEDGFYDEVFQSMGVPYEPVRWQRDVNDPSRSGPAPTSRSRSTSRHLINMYRVRGHLIAHLDPLDWKEPHTHAELDPATYGLTIWDLDREFLTDGLAGRDRMTLGDILGILRDAYCRTVGVEYMHIQEPDQKRWIQEHVEGRLGARHPRGAAPDPRAAERGRGAGEVPRDQVHRPEALRARRCRVGHRRCSTRSSTRPPKPAWSQAVLGMAHRGRLNVLINIVGKGYGELFKEFEGNIDPDIDPGIGRRQVPQGIHRQVHRSFRQDDRRATCPPTRRTSRRSTPSSRAWPGPGST